MINRIFLKCHLLWFLVKLFLLHFKILIKIKIIKIIIIMMIIIIILKMNGDQNHQFLKKIYNQQQLRVKLLN